MNRDKGCVATVLLPVIGFIFCISIIGLLNVAPMIAKKDGYVWSPLNSRQYKVGIFTTQPG
jgi:hypothetical protein